MILFGDLDGTLQSAHWRVERYLFGAGKRDYDAFHGAHVSDRCTPGVLALYANWHDRLVLCSGRNERWRSSTMDQLVGFGLGVSDLHLRPDGDYSMAGPYKLGVLRGLGVPPSDVLCVDDDPRVIAALEAGGYRCIRVVDPCLPPLEA